MCFNFVTYKHVQNRNVRNIMLFIITSGENTDEESRFSSDAEAESDEDDPGRKKGYFELKEEFGAWRLKNNLIRAEFEISSTSIVLVCMFIEVSQFSRQVSLPSPVPLRQSGESCHWKDRCKFAKLRVSQSCRRYNCKFHW